MLVGAAARACRLRTSPSGPCWPRRTSACCRRSFGRGGRRAAHRAGAYCGDSARSSEATDALMCEVSKLQKRGIEHAYVFSDLRKWLPSWAKLADRCDGDEEPVPVSREIRELAKACVAARPRASRSRARCARGHGGGRVRQARRAAADGPVAISVEQVRAVSAYSFLCLARLIGRYSIAAVAAKQLTLAECTAHRDNCMKVAVQAAAFAAGRRTLPCALAGRRREASGAARNVLRRRVPPGSRRVALLARARARARGQRRAGVVRARPRCGP